MQPIQQMKEIYLRLYTRSARTPLGQRWELDSVSEIGKLLSIINTPSIKHIKKDIMLKILWIKYTQNLYLVAIIFI